MRRYLLAASLVLLSACGTPARINYYTLTVPPAPPGASVAAHAPSVYVGPVSVPETVRSRAPPPVPGIVPQQRVLPPEPRSVGAVFEP